MATEQLLDNDQAISTLIRNSSLALSPGALLFPESIADVADMASLNRGVTYRYIAKILSAHGIDKTTCHARAKAVELCLRAKYGADFSFVGAGALYLPIKPTQKRSYNYSIFEDLDAENPPTKDELEELIRLIDSKPQKPKKTTCIYEDYLTVDPPVILETEGALLLPITTDDVKQQANIAKPTVYNSAKRILGNEYDLHQYPFYGAAGYILSEAYGKQLRLSGFVLALNQTHA